MSEHDEHPEPELHAVHPLREVWTIAWPTVLTMTSYTVMQFVDSLMVGQVGPLEVAAQGNGAVWTFVPIAMVFGFLTVVNTYVSQNLGAGRPENGPKYGWAGIWMSLAIWAGVLLPLAAIMPYVFPLTHDRAAIEQFDRLVRMETLYAQILLVGGCITLCSRAMHHYFFGLHRPKVITVSALIGNSVNAIANYALIFGEAGLPKLGLPGIPGVPALGVYGAAVGTLIGTAVEFAIPFVIFIGPKMNAELRTRAAWRPRWRPVRDLYKIGWPAATQYGNELICWSIFMTILVGKFGEHHMTAGWIALRYMHLSFMPAVGFSVAATSLVGRYIGAKEPDTAAARARLTLALAMAYMTICGLIFFFFRRPLVEVFMIGADVSPEVKADIVSIGAKLMICAAVFQWADAIGIVYTGALRGAGDTVFPGVITMILSWLFVVAGGWAMATAFPQFESVGPWIGAAAYIIVLGLVLAWRFESGFWRSIRLLDLGEPEAAPPRAAAEQEGALGELAPKIPGPAGGTAPLE